MCNKLKVQSYLIRTFINQITLTIIMKSTFFISLAFACVLSCSPIQPALSLQDTGKLESHRVKGRQGLLINQKLSFGEYQTSRVKRSWTKGGNTRISIPLLTHNGIYFPD